VARAVRHPLKAWSRVPRLFERRKLEQAPSADRRVRITPDECYEHLVKTIIVTQNFQERFSGHKTFDVFYEDLSADLDGTLANVEEFLGVEPEPATITMRRQNPEPLRDLIANYDELRAAFASSEYASLFDE
jgi:hypothetical protein